jgi:hypothetical protein
MWCVEPMLVWASLVGKPSQRGVSGWREE